MQPSPTNVSPPSPIEAPSSDPPLADSSKRLVPWLMAVAFFMESLDTTILNTAVPTIAAALHVAPLSMKPVAQVNALLSTSVVATLDPN